MSLAEGGVLRRPLTEADLREILKEIYKPEGSWLLSFRSILKKDRKEADA